MTTKCGYIALLGRPNAGKSTMLNGLIQGKIAGVSAKPQTTRNKILGVITEGELQFLFLDTPGMHLHDKRKFNALMNREAKSVLVDADAVCYLVDIAEGWQDEDRDYLIKIAAMTEAPLLLIGSKSDKKKFEIITRNAALANREMASLHEEGLLKDNVAEEVLLISGKRPADLVKLKELLATYLPDGPFLFEADDMTDRSQKFVCGELIREALFRLLGQELPYQLAVTVDKIEEKEDVVVLDATIIVARSSQKAMVIGKKGSKIKEIGQLSRGGLEAHFGRKVYLQLEVIVSENWIESKSLIAEFTQLDPT
jgi:GTP-binding protein Era